MPKPFIFNTSFLLLNSKKVHTPARRSNKSQDFLAEFTVGVRALLVSAILKNVSLVP